MTGGGEAMAGNGQLQRVRDLERRVSRVEERVDRIEDGDQQAVLIERMANFSRELAAMRGEVKWLRRTIVGGVAAIVLPLVVLILQLGPPA